MCWFGALKCSTEPALTRALQAPLAVSLVQLVLFLVRSGAVRSSRPGVHADARRKEHRNGGEAHPQHVALAIANDAVGQ